MKRFIFSCLLLLAGIVRSGASERRLPCLRPCGRRGGGRHAQPELCPAGGRPAGRARGKAHYLHGLSGRRRRYHQLLQAQEPRHARPVRRDKEPFRRDPRYDQAGVSLSLSRPHGLCRNAHRSERAFPPEALSCGRRRRHGGKRPDGRNAAPVRRAAGRN